MDKKTFSQYESQSVNRIRELIATRCNGSQQEFADRTHISKASISQYVNGRNTPSNLTAQKIADAFMVDPAWVQGFDVPMKEQTYYTNPETAAKAQELFDRPEMRILFDAAQDAKPEDLRKAAEYLEFLKWGGKQIEYEAHRGAE